MSNDTLPRPQRIVTLTPNPVLDRTLTVPQVTLDTVLRATEVRLDAGGKGFNVARALTTMGAQQTFGGDAVLAMALVGGATGALLESMLHAWGVATRFVQVQEETRTNIVVTEADGARHLKVNEPGPLISAFELEQLLAAVDDEVRSGDLWVLAGSLPRGLAPDFYARLVTRIQARGARVALDASGEALRLGLTSAPFLAKPNGLEVAEATGLPVNDPSEAAAAARRLVAMGVAIAAISLGSDGLVVGSAVGGGETQVLHARPPTITARNTVGAGDAAVSGCLWALLLGEDADSLARWGAACGTAAAARAGVTFGTLDEVAAVANQVQVRRL
ncbi:MAG: 1-phosphofructokinase family hexose kinase [Caldilineaceae bacterium]